MSDLLPERARTRLVDTCEDVLGDALRSATYFTRDDFEQVYLRGDLEKDADLTSFVGYEWREFGITQDAYLGTELGPYEYTIRAFENGYLLRVDTEHEGVFVTTESVGMSTFEQLAYALEELLADWSDTESERESEDPVTTDSAAED